MCADRQADQTIFVCTELPAGYTGFQEVNTVDVEIRIDEAVPSPKVIIVASAMNDEVAHLVSLLSGAGGALAGSRDGTVQLLEPEDILRIFTSGRQVLAATREGDFTLRVRLYEVEERLRGRRFVRISNAEIVNLRHVKHFDVSKSGVFCVVLDDGTTTFVSRRYIPAVRKLLEM